MSNNPQKRGALAGIRVIEFTARIAGPSCARYLDDPLLGRIDVVNASIKYLNGEARVRGPAPMLGEHNAEVLSEVIGYSKDKIAALRDKGVLQSAEK